MNVLDFYERKIIELEDEGAREIDYDSVNHSYVEFQNGEPLHRRYEPDDRLRRVKEVNVNDLNSNKYYTGVMLNVDLIPKRHSKMKNQTFYAIFEDELNE